MRNPSRRAQLLVGVGVVLCASVLYLSGTARCKTLGFPLDDAWIHQTYARNLAETGQFAYVPGQVSAGSTSPLWTLMLALGYLLHLPPTLWAYALGVAGWLATGWTGAALARRIYPQQRSAAIWVGLACLAEWHLAWAALSGMETTLFTFLSLLLIERYASRARPFVLGVIGGCLLLARPEGAVLVCLLAGVIVLDRLGARSAPDGVWAKRLWLLALEITAGLAVLVVPYLVFNVVVSGQLFPNTFYAKQAEYADMLARPIWVRLWWVLRRPLTGAQVLLIPGFVWQTVSVVRARAKDVVSPYLRLLPGVWWATYLAVYALRLPVDYQYGRYLMPTIPFFVLYGVVGTARWVRPRAHKMTVRLLSRALPIATMCLFIAFLLIGRQAYADDVCVINGEMVDVALWLRTNTPADALVAAHDIGAIGYLGERVLLDLAGLISPEVIPFMRDEAQLLQFILGQHADYVVTFPSWYPIMTADERLLPVYQTEYALTQRKGGDNMTVYLVRK